MNWYRCLIRGENFPGALVGEDHLVGFFTTQYVQDVSADAAEMKALARLKQHPSLQLPDGVEKSKAARVYFDEIVEVAGDEVTEQQLGLSFFPMEG